MELVNYHTATWKHQPWITAVVFSFYCQLVDLALQLGVVAQLAEV